MFKVLITTLFSASYLKAENVSVVISKGVIQGSKQHGYNTFFGVPYAKVDEDNPFGSYLVPTKFETPFIANDSTIICPQVVKEKGGTLQCLRLNIYVPHTASANNTVPILVWFYGGGFAFGGAGNYGGQHLVKHNIIVIIVNYRLGPYGFLCLNDPSVPGNQGLKDQIGALRWIKKYISAFGGDPSQVTIAGGSYGGGGVDLHLYSKYDTLFDKAIVQSGSLYSPDFFVKRDSDTALKLAIHLGFYVTKTKDALKILSKQAPTVVMAAAKNLSIRLTVCKEKRFLGVQNFITKCRFHLNNQERIENMPILIGYNSKESFSTYANKGEVFYDNLQDIFYRDFENYFILKPWELQALSNITWSFYLGSKSIDSESMNELSDYSSDFKLNYAVEKSINRYMEQGARVYKYLFSYIGGSVFKNLPGVGAIHTEELKYLFETSQKLRTDEQRMMRDRMTMMWANFVKFGNPTPEETPLLPVRWTPVTGYSRPYMDINVNMTMKDRVFQQRIAFWELIALNYNRKV